MVRVNGVLSCTDCGYNESFAQSGFNPSVYTNKNDAYDTPPVTAAAPKQASADRSVSAGNNSSANNNSSTGNNSSADTGSSMANKSNLVWFCSVYANTGRTGSPNAGDRQKKPRNKRLTIIFIVLGIWFTLNFVIPIIVGLAGLLVSSIGTGTPKSRSPKYKSSSSDTKRARGDSSESVLYESLPSNMAQKLLPESPAVREAVSEILGRDISALSGSDLNAFTELRIYEINYDYMAVEYTLSDGSSGTVYPVSQDFDASDIVCFKELERLDISDVSDYGLDLTGLDRLTALYADDVPNGIGNMIDISQITELGIYGLYGSIDKLASFENVETLYLDCGFMENLDILEKFPKLKNASLESLNYVGDISVLYRLKGLEGLYLDSPDMDSVEFIAENMPDIKELTITESNVADFSPLAACIKLEKLNLIYNEDAADYGFASGLSALTELNIYGSYNAENLPGLSALEGLKKLGIGGYNDLSVLSVPDGIEELTIYYPSYYCFWENGENIFLKFPNLRRLNIESGTISDKIITQIAALPNIETLDFEYTYFTGSIEPLLKAESIREIYAKNTSFFINMTSLSDYGHIECLNLSNADIYDLSKEGNSNNDNQVTDEIERFLECFSGLKKLYAEDDKIDSLAFVGAMPELELLDIQENSITSLNELKGAECLKLVICTKNPIEDMAGLEDIVVFEESYY